LKELLLICTEENTATGWMERQENKTARLCDKIRKNAKEAAWSVYSVNSPTAIEFASSISLDLRLHMKVCEAPPVNGPVKKDAYEAVSNYMNLLANSDKGTVIMITLQPLIPYLIGWWLKLPFENLNDMHYEAEPFSFNVLNINKTGDRTLIKYNEC
jgi:hypothetical protein